MAEFVGGVSNTKLTMQVFKYGRYPTRPAQHYALRIFSYITMPANTRATPMKKTRRTHS
jgi:hypothetical protein